ncbi:O-antigen ligase family protein [uncultured Amnibacterium sp.]|uniref:O-antigen ligase family protein n=1 Tax=uncultured Amnibacterium sp. TaxID=1631851 RepID=UPI0035CC7CE0
MQLRAGRRQISVRDAFLTRSVRSPGSLGRSDILAGAASVLCCLGLFTLSWEQLGNIGLGSYNVKLPVVLFTIAAIVGAPRWWASLRRIRALSRPARLVVPLAVAVVVILVVRSLTASPVSAGLAQVAAVLTGAVAPALAVLAVVATRADVAWALRWIIAGAGVAGVFGLWQLFAFYVGLPQLITYTGVGTSGVGGRISAFSYEPAYFAYFLVFAGTAVIALAVLEQRRVRWLAIGFFGVILTLVNVRALTFVLPVAAVLLLVSFRQNRRVVARSAAAAAVLIVASLALPFAVDFVASHLPTPQTTTATGPESPRAKESTRAEPTSTPSAKPLLPLPVAPPTEVLDPNEPSSNEPRLALYRAVLRVDQNHIAFGVGPGQLRRALAEVGYVAPNQGEQVVANNIWLQAAADGGVLLLLVELSIVVMVALLWWSLRRTAVQPLASGWLAVVLVGGMLTSYFFDLKVWVFLALILAVSAERGAVRQPTSEAA